MDLRVVVSISGSLVQLLAAYILVPVYGLRGLALGQVLQGTTMLLLASGLASREIGASLFTPVRWERAALLRIVRYGGGVQVAAIGQFLFEPVTKALLSRYGGLELTGYYEMANRIVLQFRSVIVSAYQALVPYVAGSGMESGRIQEVYQRSYRLLLSIAAPYYGLVGILLPIVVIIWRGRLDADFLLVADACLLGWAVNSLTSPAYFMFLGIGKTRWPVITHVAIGIASALLGAINGHFLGGVAVLWTVAGVLALGSYIVSVAFHREHGIRLRLLLPSEFLLPISGSVAAVIATAWIAEFYGNTRLPVLIAISAVLAAAIAVLTWVSPGQPMLRGIIRSLRPAQAA